MMWSASQWPGSDRAFTAAGRSPMLGRAGRWLTCRAWQDRRLGAAPAPMGAALGEGGSVVAADAVGGHLSADRGRVTTDAAGDPYPRHIAIFDQRKADLLAFGQRQRRAWHPEFSNGRCGSTAPVITTGTVHRPLELAVLRKRARRSHRTWSR